MYGRKESDSGRRERSAHSPRCNKETRRILNAESAPLSSGQALRMRQLGETEFTH